jgi:hypothetical protein
MAWNRENINPFINMERLHESQFPDGLALLLEERDAKREKRELRAAIKASQKGYTGMKNALSIEENSSSPANVRASPESSGDSSSSGSESSNGGESPRAPRKEKKPKGEKERAKRAKDIRRLRVR